MVSRSEDSGWAWVVAFVAMKIADPRYKEFALTTRIKQSETSVNAGALSTCNFFTFFLAAMVSNFFMIGFAKSFGLFFVEFLETFNSSSSATSIIFGSQGAAFSLGSLLVMGVLMKRFSCRLLMVTGGFLFGLAIVLSSIAQSLTEAIVYMGVISGLGQSFMVGPSMVMLGQYFKKRLGLASGIAICGGSLGQFILPPFLQYTMDRYTFRGGLLILGGMFLNCMVCGALMRPLKKRSCAQNELLISAKDDKQGTRVREMTDENGHQALCVRLNGNFHDQSPSGNDMHVFDCDYNNLTKTRLFTNNDCVTRKEDQEQRTRIRNKVDVQAFYCSKDTKQECDRMLKEGQTFTLSFHSGHTGISSEFVSSLPSFPEDQTTTQHSTCCNCELIDCSLFRQPLFLLSLLCLVLGYVGTTTHVVFLPPYAKDIGLSNETIPLLLSVMGGCDLVGRLLLGYLADSSLIQRYRILMISILIQAAVAFLTFQATTFWGLVAVSIVSGLFGGVLVSLIVVVLTDFYGVQRLPQTLGVTFLFQGCMLCLCNPLFGWLRDFTGSYLSTFCLIGGFLSLSGLSLLLVPCCRKVEPEAAMDVKKENFTVNLP